MWAADLCIQLGRVLESAGADEPGAPHAPGLGEPRTRELEPCLAAIGEVKGERHVGPEPGGADARLSKGGQGLLDVSECTRVAPEDLLNPSGQGQRGRDGLDTAAGVDGGEPQLELAV